MGVKAHLQVNGQVPTNVKFIFEGEEESGSTNLEQFVREHMELLKTDLVYSSDGPVHESGRPAIVMGVRGILYVELTTKEPNRDLHSGNWGGPIQNPAWRIVDLLSTMKEPKTGKILIQGFYDKIRPPTKEERKALRSIPLNRKKIADDLGIDEKRLPKAEKFYERLMFQPTLNICGFSSGYTGRGMKTVLPSTATIKMDMRLVSNQDPDDIFAKLSRHVKKVAPEVQVRKLGQMRPSRTALDNRYVKPVIEAVKAGTGEDPVVFPSLGGSMPDYVFTGILSVPSIMVPYANFDESNHAPNENFSIEYFMKGIRCCAAVLSHLS
jgi:acetylornithine deacetylase/succinyl-diaminopimelate desuccinylase-like protein